MSRELGIIGGGNMGAAIVRGAIAAGVIDPQNILVAEIDPSRRAQVGRTGCATTEDPAEAAACAQMLLAVKPQSFADVAKAVAPLAKPTIVISIMAGLGSGVIRRALGESARVVRVMPNTPCQVGAGVAAIALGDGAAPGDERLARELFDALGRTTTVDEGQMYAVTAVSGSGPAYVFLLAEALEQAAVDLGIDSATARLLVHQTVFGSGKLLLESDQEAVALRQAVTSPGGTTEAALAVMLEQRFAQIIAEAVTAARDRGIELDQG